MTHHTPISEQLYAEACTCIPGGVNSPVRAFRQVGGTPVYFQSGQGSRVIDVDGNSYVDFCQSWGPLILGHANPKVVAAVQEAAPQGLSYGACHKGEIEIAKMILEGFDGYDRVRLVSSGTEAVMTALRIARGVTGRNLVLKFEGGYHGHFDGMLVKAGSGLATHAIASSKGIPQGIAESTLVAPLGDEEAVKAHFETYGNDIAAIIIEPMPANNGLLLQRTEFLQFLRDITKAHGALLIFDEVISGFRLRYGGFGQSLGIVPDMVTLGKIIGGGMPVGAIVGTAEHLDKLSPLGAIYQAGTLSGNPVSLAAGIATLKILRDESPYQRLEALGALFEETLKKSELPAARARRMGSIVWPYFDTPAFPSRADAISEVAMKRFTAMYWPLLEAGYYLPPSSYEVLFISAAHSEDDVRGLAQTMASLLREAE